jgi:hypothetical protein
MKKKSLEYELLVHKSENETKNVLMIVFSFELILICFYLSDLSRKKKEW